MIFNLLVSNIEPQRDGALIACFNVAKLPFLYKSVDGCCVLMMLLLFSAISVAFVVYRLVILHKQFSAVIKRLAQSKKLKKKQKGEKEIHAVG